MGLLYRVSPLGFGYWRQKKVGQSVGEDNENSDLLCAVKAMKVGLTSRMISGGPASTTQRATSGFRRVMAASRPRPCSMLPASEMWAESASLQSTSQSLLANLCLTSSLPASCRRKAKPDFATGALAKPCSTAYNPSYPQFRSGS